MRIKAKYVRALTLEDGPVADTAVGIDIGTANFAVGRMTRLAKNDRYVLEQLTVVNLCGDENQQDADTLGDNLMSFFSHPDRTWVWEPPSPIVPERQVDNIAAVNPWWKKKQHLAGVEEDDGTRFKPPIMTTVYGMIKIIVKARTAPALLLDNGAWSEMMLAGLDPTSESIARKGIVWVPRSGSQKTGLKGFHGDARKDQTLIAAPHLLRENKDHAAATYIESLPTVKRKPQEDACDVVLQTHHFLEERRVNENKKRKREEREEAKVEKEETKRIAKKPRADTPKTAAPASRPKARFQVSKIKQIDLVDIDDVLFQEFQF